MSRRKPPALSNETARCILNELSLYATDKQFYPLQNTLWAYMAKPQWNYATLCHDPARYPALGQWTFNYWFERLVEDGHIEIDKATRAIRAAHLEIVEKADLE